MTVFWKMCAIVLLTVILGTAIAKTEKDFTVVLTVGACCLIAMASVEYLSDVTAFLWRLGNAAQCGNSFLEILLKIAGVAIMSELTGLISADAGFDSLGKAVQILGNSVILFLSLPVFESFFTVIQEILRLA